MRPASDRNADSMAAQYCSLESGDIVDHTEMRRKGNIIIYIDIDYFL